MNIFVFDKCPVVTARMHCDKHVVKMIVETAQMLCTTLQYFGIPARYKPAYVNHPCNKWVRESLKNYDWLCQLGIALCREYTHRYGKIHKSESVIKDCCCKNPPIPEKELTPFAQAMPEQFKNENPVIAYRDYFNSEKAHFAKWTKREIPEWVRIRA